MLRARAPAAAPTRRTPGADVLAPLHPGPGRGQHRPALGGRGQRGGLAAAAADPRRAPREPRRRGARRGRRRGRRGQRAARPRRRRPTRTRPRSGATSSTSSSSGARPAGTGSWSPAPRAARPAASRAAAPSPARTSTWPACRSAPGALLRDQERVGLDLHPDRHDRRRRHVVSSEPGHRGRLAGPPAGGRPHLHPLLPVPARGGAADDGPGHSGA